MAFRTSTKCKGLLDFLLANITTAVPGVEADLRSYGHNGVFEIGECPFEAKR